MSEKHEKQKKKKASLEEILPALIPIVIVTVVGLGIAWENLGSHVYGTTPAQIEALSLEGTPKQVAKGLSSTDVRSTYVRAKFKTSAGGNYEYFELTWSSDSKNAPTSMELVPEHEKKEEEDRGDDVVAALARRFHALHDGSWRWGRVEITAHKRDGELDARVDATSDKKPNPLFDRQMDAARQVLLEAAFGIPVHASDADLAELLGAGYKTADVGRIDPQTTIDAVPALMASRFPGAIHESSSRWRIAVDHPLLADVTFDWDNRRGGALTDVRLDVDDAYESSRDALETCLANVLGAPQIKTTDYAAGKKDYVFGVGSLVLTLSRREITLRAPIGWDGAFLAKTFDAFAGCHDKTENTGARGDGRKK